MLPRRWEHRKSAYLRQTTNQLLYRLLHPTAEDKRIQRVYMLIFWVVFVCEVLIFFVLFVTAPAVLARLPSGAASIPGIAVILASFAWRIRAIVQELKANEAAGMAPALQTTEDTRRLVFWGTTFLFFVGWMVIGSDLRWDFFVTFGGLAGVAIVGEFSSHVALRYLQRRDRHRAAQHL